MIHDHWWERFSLYIEAVTPLRFFIYSAVYAVALYALGNTMHAVLIIAALLSVYTIVYVLKITTRVKRRSDARIALDHPDRAFPSGHAAAVAFLIPAITLTAPWGMPVITVILTSAFACAVILSRLSLRVHTIPQVLIGALIGLVIPLIVLSSEYTQSLFGMV